MSDQIPAVGENVNHLIELIDQNTGGRVKITRFPVDSIVPSTDLLTSTATGVINMATTSGNWWKGIIPVATIEEALPGSWRDGHEQNELFFDYGLIPLLRQEYAKQGVHFLVEWSNNPTQQGLSLNQPVSGLADFQGKKIRAIGTTSDWVADLGGTPVPTPFGEMYSALSTGVIDGAITPWDAQLAMKLYEQAPNLVLPTLAAAPGLNILITLDDWNEMPSDLQMIVQLTANDWAAWCARYYSPRAMPDVAKMEAAGFKTVTWDNPQDLAKINEVNLKIWDAVAASDPFAAEGINIMKNYFKEIGRPGF
jgi:TRAP-type C4-dicarboxylate transport system substrate-binding protein